MLDTANLTFYGVQLVIQSISRQFVIVFILVTKIGHSYRRCPYLNLIKSQPLRIHPSTTPFIDLSVGVKKNYWQKSVADQGYPSLWTKFFSTLCVLSVGARLRVGTSSTKNPGSAPAEVTFSSETCLLTMNEKCLVDDTTTTECCMLLVALTRLYLM